MSHAKLILVLLALAAWYVGVRRAVASRPVPAPHYVLLPDADAGLRVSGGKATAVLGLLTVVKPGATPNADAAGRLVDAVLFLAWLAAVVVAWRKSRHEKDEPPAAPVVTVVFPDGIPPPVIVKEGKP